MALSTCALGTHRMMSDSQALCADWIYLIQNHKVITQQDWLEGSPKYGVIRYHAPEWHMWATRQDVAETVTITTTKKLVDVRQTVWCIQMPNLILEFKNVHSYKVSSHPEKWRTVWDSWNQDVYEQLLDQIPQFRSHHVGDPSEFEGMITHYRLMHNWH